MKGCFYSFPYLIFCLYFWEELTALQIKLSIMKPPSVLIAHPSTAQELMVAKAFFKSLKIKFETAEKSPYNPEFVSKIQRSRKQAATGKTVKIALDDIWK